MQNKIIQKIYLSSITVILILLAACGTTSSSALPQATIPLPTNDPVTISSPDTSGLVTITAATNAVPASAKIIVSVSNGASLNLDFYSQSGCNQ